VAAWLTTFLTHPTTLVGAGGAAGSIARYWVGRWFRMQPWAENYFWGTFSINVTGSIILGIVAALFKDRAGTGYLLFGTGFCGGYTTFSTFSLEVVEFAQKGRYDLAGIYIGTSLLGGFLGFLIAFLAVRSAAA
jgi:CrcB protein